MGKNILEISFEELKEEIIDNLNHFYETKDLISSNIYANSFHNVYRLVEECLNEYKEETTLIIATKNPLCDFGLDIRNIFSDKKPIVFNKVIEGKLISIELDISSLDESTIVLFENTNFYNKKLIHNIVKFPIGKVMQINHFLKVCKLDKADASANNTVSHIYIKE